MNIFFENINNFNTHQYELWFNEASPIKQNKIKKLNHTNRQKTAILSDHLARLAVSYSIGVDTKEVIFSYGTHEKPFIYGNAIYFNISHKGDYVVCVWADTPCGIDIEIIKEVKLSSAKRFCTENELNFIMESDNKNQAFLYIWTRKEAYFKSLGCGISTVLSAVDVLKTDGFETKIEKDYILSYYIKKT